MLFNGQELYEAWVKWTESEETRKGTIRHPERDLVG